MKQRDDMIQLALILGVCISLSVIVHQFLGFALPY